MMERDCKMLDRLNTCGEIIANEMIGPGCHQLQMRVAGDFPPPRPGQFALLRFLSGHDPLLGRPLGIYDFDPLTGMISFVYRVVGRGTALLSRQKKGDALGLFGPLGRPFAVPETASRLLLVAGGIGAAALNFLARKHHLEHQVICYLGARSAREWNGLPQFNRTSYQIKLTTEDGSAGVRGLITELIEQDLPHLAAAGTYMYACGPRGMLARLALLLQNSPLSCQVSMEERMACGLGACLGCVVKRADPRQISYARVCCEGPVFDIREIAW